VPSAELLSEWAAKFQILHSAIYWQGTPSVIEPPDDMPNPNDLDELDNARFWVPHTEYYDQRDYQHVQFFSNLEDLMARIVATDWRSVREAMVAENQLRIGIVEDLWANAFGRLFSSITPADPSYTHKATMQSLLSEPYEYDCVCGIYNASLQGEAKKAKLRRWEEQLQQPCAERTMPPSFEDALREQYGTGIRRENEDEGCFREVAGESLLYDWVPLEVNVTLPFKGIVLRGETKNNEVPRDAPFQGPGIPDELYERLLKSGVVDWGKVHTKMKELEEQAQIRELTWVEQRELELASAHFSDVKRPEPTVKIL